MSPGLDDLSDGEIRRRKFAVMKKICDEKHLPYSPSLVAYLERQKRDGKE